MTGGIGCAQLAAVLGAVLAVSGCAAERARRHDAPCTVPRQVVDDYLYRLIDLTTGEMNPGIAPRRDGVTISFRLGADGSATNIRVMRASSPGIGAEAERAVRALSPYPAPPFVPEACLLGARAEMQLFSMGRCEESAAGAYGDAMMERIRAALAGTALADLPGERTVTLRIDLGAHGELEAVEAVGPRSERVEEVMAVVRGLGPFEPPADSIRECVSDGPFVLWVDVPGPIAAE